MNRPIWKGVFEDPSSYAKLNDLPDTGKAVPLSDLPTIWSRRSTVGPHWVGRTVKVYTGNKFVKLTVTAPMVGQKWGAFAATRSSLPHGGKLSRNRRK